MKRIRRELGHVEERLAALELHFAQPAHCLARRSSHVNQEAERSQPVWNGHLWRGAGSGTLHSGRQVCKRRGVRLAAGPDTLFAHSV